MTITGLWPFYSKNVGYGELSVSELKGTLVSSDSFGSMHQMRSVPRKQHIQRINPFSTAIDEEAVDDIWLARSLTQVIEMLTHGFIPILVYDGKKSPLKLANAGKKRAADSAAAEKQLLELTEKHALVDPLLIPAKDIATARTLLEASGRMPRTSIQKYIDLFKGLGIPWAQALGEGERTCALMNRDGVCSAILSNDGDCLAFGGQLILREKIDIYSSEGLGSAGYSTARIEPLLDELGMDFKLFQQLCIMSGTDFNKNIPKIGFGRSIPLLKKYRSISNIGKDSDLNLDVSILNYRKVKKEFEIVPWQQTVSDYSLELKSDAVSDAEVLKKYGLEGKLASLTRAKARALAALQAKTTA